MQIYIIEALLLVFLIITTVCVIFLQGYPVRGCHLQ